MTRIAVATCAHHPGFIANDDQPLLDALHRRAARAELCRWDDAATDWHAFDAVVIRTTWDYQERLDEFLTWIDRVDSATHLINDAQVIKANISKTYMRTLEQAGVPIVPTRWVEPGEPAAHRLDGLDGEIVVKPVVGAGASGLARLNAADHSAIDAHIAGLGRTALIQPFVSTVYDRGEISVVLIDGRISHAVRKIPSPGEFRVQIEFGGQYTVVQPTAQEADVCQSAIEALCPAPPAIARVDLIDLEPGAPVVGEVELIEPELFLAIVPDGAERLADAILQRLSSRPGGLSRGEI